MVDVRSRGPDDGTQNPEQSAAPDNQDPSRHDIPIEGALAKIGLGEGTSDPDRRRDQSTHDGPSSRTLTAREEQTTEEGGIRERGEMAGEEDAKVKEEDKDGEDEERRESEGVQRMEEMVRDKYAKVTKDMNVGEEEKGDRRGRGRDENPSNSIIAQPDLPTARERRASDVVRIFHELVDEKIVAIPPDSSDRRGAWAGEKQRKMDEELRKIYEERQWSA